MTHHKIHIDFETYSECDLRKHGAWVYSRHPSTRVVCAAYSLDDSPALFTKKATHEFIAAWLAFLISNKENELHAFNSFFECCIIANTLKLPHLIDFNQWHDTMALACAAAWPQSLGNITNAMPFDESFKKDKAGKKLIQQLSVPQKITKGADKGKLVDPIEYWGDEYPAMLQKFKDYCVQDVIAEREVSNRLRPLSKTERKVWVVNQKINWRGMKCDVPFALTAYKLYEQSKQAQLRRIGEITGLSNPNSPKQVKQWLADNGEELPNMQSATLTERVAGIEDPTEPEEVMQLRLESARTPPKKFLTMVAMSDRKTHRTHGLLTYHGASTGRTASRGINTLNLPRPIFKDYKTPVNLVKQRDLEAIELFYGAPIDTLCSIIRPALTASKGCRLIAPDYSSIEPRVLHWIAGAQETLHQIREGDAAGDSSRIYKIAAAGVFDMAPEEVEKGTNEYQGGKALTLAGGYQGWYRAVDTMADELKIEIKVPQDFKLPKDLKGMVASENALRKSQHEDPMNTVQQYTMFLVREWRKVNPKVTALWYACGDAALNAVKNPGRKFRVGEHLVFKAGKYRGTNYLWIRLPSGRLLSYVKPHIKWKQQVTFVKNLATGKQEKVIKRKEQLKFFGIDSKTKQWCVKSTYGGKLVENIVQAIARDVMEAACLRLQGTVYENIVLTVYDEIVSDVKNGLGSAEEMSALICKLEAWMKGMPLVASAEELYRYWK